MRRFAVLAVLCVAASAVIANASGGGQAGTSSATSVRLPTLDRCIVGGTIRVTLTPPAGTSFQSLTVRAGGREMLQLADLSGPGSLVVPIPRRSTRVEVGATTSTGRFISAARTYSRCARRTTAERRPRRRAPAPSAPPVRTVAVD